MVNKIIGIKIIEELSFNHYLPNFLDIIQVANQKFMVHRGPQMSRMKKIYTVHVSNVHSSERTNLNFVNKINY